MENQILGFGKTLGLFFISQKRRISLLVTIFVSVLICATVIIYKISCPDFSTTYHEIIYPIITLLTFFSAFLLGIFKIYEDWKNTLEKRLTIFYIYYYEDKETIKKISISKPERAIKDIEFIEKKELQPNTPYCFIVFEETALAHEGDIRAWAQSLGQQINDGTRLEFYPFHSLGRNQEIVKVKDNHEETHITRQYSFFIFLEKIPEIIHINESGILITDNYDDTPINKKKFFKFIKFNYQDHRAYKQIKQFLKDNLVFEKK